MQRGIKRGRFSARTTSRNTAVGSCDVVMQVQYMLLLDSTMRMRYWVRGELVRRHETSAPS